ncbi:DNA cytosine methyltransferase [Mycobacteroides abscessus]|uniref:DNA cytosine methyltransferase n=1 Tax=Mycobacteroides abscessus TaxID=36809 RepID=UPI0009CD96BC|nr:DNA cytosine methyltransferase [Mycobacteroides abscessus]SLJ81146.1 site-specific DNA methylase [Mycobacteroides abscessus subsp. abscessus]SLJ81274.1 site-specific DNA methylase [Mycobacteroides abscessus subsp. abscessus]
MTSIAEYRPALGKRRFSHDDLVAVDLFSGFGGLTKGIAQAGFSTICAANHNEYKISVHEANHPEAEHWIADLVDRKSTAYHSVRDLPKADLLAAGVSCVNHSQANTKKAYEQGLSLFDLEDTEFEESVTRSERDRATANCVLHYAAQHHPRLILVECTTELTSWGPAIQGKRKVGDGSTYRWWLKQFDLLGYNHRVLIRTTGAGFVTIHDRRCGSRPRYRSIHTLTHLRDTPVAACDVRLLPSDLAALHDEEPTVGGQTCARWDMKPPKSSGGKVLWSWHA